MPTQPNYIDFDVTQEDIDNGGVGASVCPVAIAIRRATGGAFALVGWYDCAIYFGDTKQLTANYRKPVAVIYNHSYAVWIADFDANKPVRPFRGRLIRD